MNKPKIIYLLIVFITFSITAKAQKPNWQNLDLKKDGVFGISTEKAYQELLKGKTAQTVIVAVIDEGIDTTQEDLKAVIWRDPKTGIHGWNYVGAETGREDITRLVDDKRRLLYDSLSYAEIPEAYQADYSAHKEWSAALEGKRYAMQALVAELDSIQKTVDGIIKKTGKANPSLADFKNYKPQNPQEATLLKRMLRKMPSYPDWQTYKCKEITDILNKARYHLAHGLNIDDNEPDTARGNADISPDKLGPVSDPNLGAYHGTHVAGIIGAVRGNGIGMDGVADHVQLMTLKVMGNIREMKDKNLALAIRFAADHGAKVINMSLGKPYTWDKKAVDEAVKYAMKKDVIMIHAAMNNGQDIDVQPHYPEPFYKGGRKRASAWLEVGASGFKNDATLAASFSNYGKRSVDVFAPGVAIYSTLPYNQYDSWEGTSMAAPVVAGLAALIREYYPKLSAVQVKDIIMRSVVKVNHDVMMNGYKVPFSELCVSGGIVNAYTALQLAANYK